jgi:hypothetical protein
MSTPYHAKPFAHDLTRRATDGVDRLSSALFDASVDLNPHQIEAAVFISVNGSTNLENLKATDDTWKVRLLEEEFHLLMFATEDV